MIDPPANAALRRRFAPFHYGADRPVIATPDQIVRPYETLGTHPDLVTRLWDELPSQLPVDCRRVYYSRPVLMHLQTGIVFGFAGGTHTYALRLPEPQRSEALQAGATRLKHYPVNQLSFDLDEVGPEWVFCGWHKDEEAWCRAAYELAGAPPADA
jgi:hypothetical protein